MEEKKNCDRQLEEACMSIIDEMSSTAAALPPMEQFNPPIASVDLFDSHWSGLYFDPQQQQQPQQHPQPQQQPFCCNTAPLEFSPVSMPSSTLDAEELFGCPEEHSNECSCSDLLTSSLDLTGYDQEADWSKFEYPQQQQQQQHQQQPQQQQQQQQFTYDSVLDPQEPIIIDEPLNAAESYYNANWDDLSNNRVLSILEPGLDFEGLIDLDNL